jgi:hypothetical protein
MTIAVGPDLLGDLAHHLLGGAIAGFLWCAGFF